MKSLTDWFWDDCIGLPTYQDTKVESEKHWRCNPKPDITPYESALLARFLYTICDRRFNKFPSRDPELFESWDVIKRHFEEVK